MFWVGCLSVRMYVCSFKGILQQACSQILVLFFCIISSLSSVCLCRGLFFCEFWYFVYCCVLQLRFSVAGSRV